MAVLFFAWNISCVPDKSESNQAATRIVHEIALKGGDGSDLSNHLEPQMFGGRFFHPWQKSVAREKVGLEVLTSNYQSKSG